MTLNHYEVDKALSAMETVLEQYKAGALPENVQNAVDKREALRAARRNITQEAAAAEAAIATADDVEAALEVALVAAQRKKAADSVNFAYLNEVLTQHVSTALNTEMPKVLAAISAGVNKDAETIRKNLPALPANPLDAAAVVKSADSGKAYLAVAEPLDRLLNAAHALPKAKVKSGYINVQTLRLMPLINVPETAVMETTLEGKPLPMKPAHKQAADSLRAFDAAATADERTALVRLLRGDFKGLTFELATDTADIQQRAARAVTAMTQYSHSARSF